VHVKVSEHGQEENLLSEFDEEFIVDGGYHESKGVYWSHHWEMSGDQNP